MAQLTLHELRELKKAYVAMQKRLDFLQKKRRKSNNDVQEIMSLHKRIISLSSTFQSYLDELVASVKDAPAPDYDKSSPS